MAGMIPLNSLINSIAFSLVGVVVLGVSFWVFDRITPYRLWDEVVKEKNVALSIVVGSMAIAIGLIVSAAVHG